MVTKEPTENLKGISRFRFIFSRDKKAPVAISVILIFILSALFAPWLAPYDPNEMTLDMMSAPSKMHLLGTDDLGRDLLSRIIWGTQISLFVGVSTVFISLVLGVILGVVAGYYGGWADMIIMRYIDLQWAFPNFIIAVYLVAVFGTGLLNVIVAISLAFLDVTSLFIFSTIGPSPSKQQFVEAARTNGSSNMRIMFKHILPNAAAPLIVQATVCVSYAILGEASLSFLGLGVSANTPTWGLILADGRSFISQAWWLGVYPGLAIMLIVLSINFLGDSLRDTLDVKENLL